MTRRHLLAAFLGAPALPVPRAWPAAVSPIHDDGPWIQRMVDKASQSGAVFVLQLGKYRIRSRVNLAGRSYIIRGCCFHMANEGQFYFLGNDHEWDRFTHNRLDADDSIHDGPVLMRGGTLRLYDGLLLKQ